ncbi:MAG: V-type ATP synthase subunit D [Planctomycetota bacterium]
MAKRLQVNPTRMQLMELRDRLSVAVHGHSLLKDKLEGLMAEFMDLVDEYKAIRNQFNGNYPDVTKLFVLAGIAGSRDIVDDAISQASSELDMTVSQQNVLSVQVPHFEAQAHPGGGYSLLDAPLELDEATQRMADFLPQILELAEKEHMIWELMEEIERTRRRVNALEYIMIPQLRETVKYIQRKLEENERANITRLMKIKDMRLEEERQAAAEGEASGISV